MTIESYSALASTIFAFVALLLVNRQIRKATEQNKLLAEQIRESNIQAELDSLAKIHDKNDELLTLGFFVPELFGVLEDKAVDPTVKRRYLQKWFNFFLRVHSYLEKAVFKGDLPEKLIRDLSGFLKLKNAQHFWSEYRSSFPASFQRLVDDNIDP
jgi:hypothetical protein